MSHKYEELTRFFASRKGIILAGAVIGVFASLLQKFGNPPNMGICVACDFNPECDSERGFPH